MIFDYCIETGVTLKIQKCVLSLILLKKHQCCRTTIITQNFNNSTISTSYISYCYCSTITTLVCVYVCVRVCTYVHVCVHAHACVSVCVCGCACACACMWMWMCVHACMCVCTHVHVCVCMHTCVCMQYIQFSCCLNWLLAELVNPIYFKHKQRYIIN